jgi:pimeloyl-ACP methyl ester carboxylesterase
MTRPVLTPQTIQANGLDFAYLSAGEGPLVLCLHGFPDTAWSFADLLGRLAAAGYHAVAPFMRGYAPTEIPADGAYSALTLGRDVLALIEHFGADKAYIVGHDWGAMATYAAAALRPDRVRRIVVAGLPHPRRFGLHKTRGQRKASRYMLLFQLRGYIERKLRANDFKLLFQMIRASSPGWKPPEDYVREVKANFAEAGRLSAALGYYRAIPRAMFSGDARKYLLAPLRVPSRTIYGSEDRAVLPEMFADHPKLYAPEHDMIEFPDCGHFMHLQAPERFAEQVLQFLKAGA